jgi:ubiquinone/menaquinone biosynthesis C-methylase UbiE
MVQRFVRSLVWQSAVVVSTTLLVLVLGGKGWAAGPEAEPAHYVRVTSKASLIHLGSLDSFDITEGGTLAADLLYDYLVNQRRESAQAAQRIYEQIIPTENFGGEYTALQWICEYSLASDAEKEQTLTDRVAAQWYKHLAQDDFGLLKDYLKQKYHLQEWKNKATPKNSAQYRFLEDFVLFNNPRRESWEKTSKIMEVLGIKPGQVVVDLGCGPGYFTFRFSELVGDGGLVYAVDNNQQHIEYLSRQLQEFGIKNVQAIAASGEEVKFEKQADLVYLCSLYHNVYGLPLAEEREKFMASIKSMLKPGGRLVIVDNALVEGENLPYHGPYIARELVINQMWYHGFQLVAAHQFIPQRYVLAFQLREGPEPTPYRFDKPLPSDCVPLTSKSSIIRILKTTTSPGFTMEGRKAARRFLAALESKDPQQLRAVMEAYQSLSRKERIGDEYTAFEWLCEYLLASAETQQKMLADWIPREYFERLAVDDFKQLKTYLQYKYFLDEVLDDEDHARQGGSGQLKRRMLDDLVIPESAGITQDQINSLGEFIAFNNPYRDRWEQTSNVLDFLNIKPGTCVADIGSGPGYYTFRFSRLVGPQGRVYAVDTSQDHLNYINDLAKKHALANIHPVLGRENNTELVANSTDVAFICSLYHFIYFNSMNYVQESFLESIKRALTKDGRLVIADNSILDGPDDVPYYGPGIAKEPVIAQLKHHGFELVDSAQFIPQRYMLVFKKAGDQKAPQDDAGGAGGTAVGTPPAAPPAR